MKDETLSFTHYEKGQFLFVFGNKKSTWTTSDCIKVWILFRASDIELLIVTERECAGRTCGGWGIWWKSKIYFRICEISNWTTNCINWIWICNYSKLPMSLQDSGVSGHGPESIAVVPWGWVTGFWISFSLELDGEASVGWDVELSTHHLSGRDWK